MHSNIVKIDDTRVETLLKSLEPKLTLKGIWCIERSASAAVLREILNRGVENFVRKLYSGHDWLEISKLYNRLREVTSGFNPLSTDPPAFPWDETKVSSWDEWLKFKIVFLDDNNVGDGTPAGRKFSTDRRTLYELLAFYEIAFQRTASHTNPTINFLEATMAVIREAAETLRTSWKGDILEFDRNLSSIKPGPSETIRSRLYQLRPHRAEYQKDYFMQMQATRRRIEHRHCCFMLDSLG